LAPAKGQCWIVDQVAKWAIALLIVTPVLAGPANARAAAPIFDPVALNIGFNCKWQAPCIKLQQRAMKRAVGFVRKKHPPEWRIHQCNRNAARGRDRVDWVGYDNCIRNPGLIATPLPPPPPQPGRHRRRGGSRG
jgi:hypothetical protein